MNFPKNYVNDMNLTIMGRPICSNELWHKLEPKGGEFNLPQDYEFRIAKICYEDGRNRLKYYKILRNSFLRVLILLKDLL